MKIKKIVIFLGLLSVFSLGMTLLQVSKGTSTETSVKTCSHDSWKYLYTIHASCRNWGYAYYTCSVPNCYGSYTVYIEDIKSHDLEKCPVTFEATCTRPKEVLWKCKNCSYSENKPIGSALGHNYTKVTISPTCTEEGKSYFECQRDGCKAVTIQTTIPALGHFPVEVMIDATCISQGKSILRCGRPGCNYVMSSSTTPIDGNNHSNITYPSIESGTCIEKGRALQYCTGCKRTLGYILTKTNPDKHNFTMFSEETKRTCELDGKRYYKCSWCGTNSEEFFVTKKAYGLPHPYVESTRTEPTCTGSGVIVYICPREDCGSIKNETLPALGHTDSNNDKKCDRCKQSLGSSYDDDEEDISILDIM